MRMRRLGTNGPEVSAIGLGCMGMSGMYGPADREESIATIHAALDAGITLLDTGDYYGMGHNELLIREALEGDGRSGRITQAELDERQGDQACPQQPGFEVKVDAAANALRVPSRRAARPRVGRVPGAPGGRHPGREASSSGCAAPALGQRRRGPRGPSVRSG